MPCTTHKHWPTYINRRREIIILAWLVEQVSVIQWQPISVSSGVHSVYFLRAKRKRIKCYEVADGFETWLD
jgi:hypothetical protein